MKKIRLLFTVLLVFAASGVFAQNIKVTGIVTDANDGGSLLGAYIQIRGSNSGGAMTDENGKYTISCPSDAVLIFSYIGYEKLEIAVNGRSVVNAGLVSSNVLDEVVVTAMGMTRSQKSVGYATSTVKAEDLTLAKSSSLMSGIQGKMAGVSVSSSGGAGTSQKVIIRGYSSFSSNNPLYIVDGVPISNSFAGNASFADAVDFGNQAGDINPNDVETMTVLKGASATALYGSRAANGVIMITTKRAKENKIEVNYDGSFMASDVLRTPQGQDIFGEGWPYWDPAENGSWGPKMDGRNQPWGAWAIDSYGDAPAGYAVMSKPFSFAKDNIRNFYDTGFEMTNNLSIAVGNKDLGMALSYGNTNSDGVLPNANDTYNRNNISLRANARYNKFTADANINYVRKDMIQPTAGQGNNGASMFQEILQYGADVPFTALKDYKNSNFNPDNYYTFYAENPYWVIDNNQNKYQDDRIYGKIELSYEIIKGIKATARIGGDFTNSRQKRWNEKVDYASDAWSLAGGKSALPGTYRELFAKDEQLDATFLVNADYTIGDNITLGGVVGYNYNQIVHSDLDSYLYGLNNPGWFSLENGADRPLTTSYSSRRRLMGALAQADFGYKNYFFVTASARNDWSSTLPINANSFFYWGVNSSFVFSDCFTNLKNMGISFLKLRAAYGKTGNDAPIYRTSATYLPTQIGLGFGNLYLPINGIPGLTESNTIPNMNLKPEITTEIEVGLSANFIDNRIMFDGAYYNKLTKDQIISAAVSPETGYSTRTRNVGEIGNQGIELMLSGTPIKTKDIQWSIGATFTKNWSEVKKLWDDIKEYTLVSSYQVSYVAEVGKPLGIFKVPSVLKDAQGKTIVTSAGLPTIDNSKKDVLGSSNSDFQMGFNTKFTWKNFSISASADWRKGGYFYSYTAQLYYFSGNATPTVYNDRQPFIVPNSVKKNTDGSYSENDIPVRWSNTYNYYNNASNYDQFRNWVLKRDYLKLREVVISYTLPKEICEKTKTIKGVTISAIGRNLFMWTPKENNFTDPEGTNYGNDLGSEFGEFASAPTYRTFGGSIKITF